MQKKNRKKVSSSLNKFYKKPYIYELVMKNKIPHHKIGKHTYFSIIELEEWLQKTKPKE